ncbi:ornithine cyclodeaminase [Gammaproteobacteria bacterium]|nr:ornithine cyclodeaminase [Gammaproteobacteria bacterium]
MFVVNHRAISSIIQSTGVKKFMQALVNELLVSYGRWSDFDHQPRQACYYPKGVIELMPSSDNEWHAVKWINCHPDNITIGQPTIVGLGVWSTVSDGVPQMMCDMTLLTAFRTAAATGVFLKHAQTRPLRRVMIIGLGAQSDFHALMLSVLFPGIEILAYDIDDQAGQKFKNNMAQSQIHVQLVDNIKATLNQVDAVITLTAAKKRAKVLCSSWIQSPLVIAAVGGDAPGKTELDAQLIKRSDIMVQYWPQTQKEGEIQNETAHHIYHLYQAIKQPVSVVDRPLIFDSVGFAIEDHACMRYIWQLVQNCPEYNVEFFPDIHQNPKDLWQSMMGS